MNRQELIHLFSTEQKKIFNDAQLWMDFLEKTPYLSNFNFVNKVLLFSQKPDLTAVTHIDHWNKRERYVNRGSKGAYVFTKKSSTGISKQYFDIGDTYGNHVKVPEQIKVKNSDTLKAIAGLSNNNYELFDKNSQNINKAIQSSKVLDYAIFLHAKSATMDILAGNCSQHIDLKNSSFKDFIFYSTVYSLATKYSLDTISYANEVSNLMIEPSVYEVLNKNQLSILIGHTIESSIDNVIQVVDNSLQQEMNTTDKENFQNKYKNIDWSMIDYAERNIEDGSNRGNRTSPKSGGSNGYAHDYQSSKVWDIGSQQLTHNDVGILERGILADGNNDEKTNDDELILYEGKRYEEESSDAETSNSDIRRIDGQIPSEVSTGLGKPQISLADMIRNNSIEDKSGHTQRQLDKLGFSVGTVVFFTENTEFLVQEIKKESLIIANCISSETLEIHVDDFLGLYTLERSASEDILDTKLSSADEPIFSMIELDTAKIEEDVTLEIEKNNIAEDVIGNFYYSNFSDDLAIDIQKGKKEIFTDNISAINTLKILELEGRLPNADEQVVLSKYAGWGGLSDAFDDTKSNYATEYEILKETLTEDEYLSARESTLSSFYTPNYIVENVYAAVMNFQPENDVKILDCSMGTGRFFSNLPTELQSATLHGIELDDVTSRISKALYPDATIFHNSFENINTVPEEYDLVVSNIPFGDYRVNDITYNKHNFLIHDYFFAKAIDSTREGGVLAFITSSGTLDKKDSKVREYLDKKADLIGAIRLPNTAFKNAGTSVTTDIVFLQKNTQEHTKEISNWISISEDNNGLHYNQYFIDNPDMVLGNPKIISGQFGEVLTMEPSGNLEEQLVVAISQLQAQIPSFEREANNNIPIAPGAKKYSYYYDKNADCLYYADHSFMSIFDTSEKNKQRIIDMIDIKDTIRKITIEQSSICYSDEKLNELRAGLNGKYDEFVSTYGYLNSKTNYRAFYNDVDCNFLMAVEKQNREDNSIFEKELIFFENTVKPIEILDSTNNAIDAYYLCLSQRGAIDFEFIQSIYNHPKDNIIQELGDLIYLDPSNTNNDGSYGWVSREEYLSGDIDSKIRHIKNTIPETGIAHYQRNLDALETAKPRPIEAGEIEVYLGANWIPSNIYDEFMYELFQTSSWQKGTDSNDIHCYFNGYLDTWRVVNKTSDRSVEATQVYGTSRMSAYSILEKSLNLQTPRIYDYDYDNKAILNEYETSLARGKQKVIEQEFTTWIFNNQERREELVRRYNRIFNSVTLRKYDGSYLNLPDLADTFTPYPHQLNAIARIIDNGNNTLLNHEVGLGKTATMIMGANERLRLGLSNRVMITVPNHITNQFQKEIYTLYPNSKVMVVSEKDFAKNNRERFLSKIAMSDTQIVVIGHTQFSRIAMSNQFVGEMINEEVQDVMHAIKEQKEKFGDSISVKQYEKTLVNLRERLSKNNTEAIRDNVISFEELGVDTLMVDEADLFKNGYLKTKLQNVAGVGTADSQRANDMLAKTRYISSIGGKIVFATGTPISNALSETYIMQRYLQEKDLQNRGILTFDNWVGAFAKTTTTSEPTPEGEGLRPKTRLSTYYNIPELKTMFGMVSDVVTIDDTVVKRPKANIHTIECEASDFQRQWMSDAVQRCRDIRSGAVSRSEDNMLVFTTEAKSVSLDERLVDPTASYNSKGKIEKLCNQVLQEYKNSMNTKGAQIIFCDKGTPNSLNFNVYDEVKRVLIEKGIDADEMKFIHDAKNNLEKEEIFSNVRSGSVRVLLASTEKAGAGTNIQERLVALHDLDCPYRPRDINQRHGRIIRQGNIFDEVNIYQYISKGTFDAYSWNILTKKQQFISQFNKGDALNRSFKDEDSELLNFETVQAIATDNPLLIEKIQVDSEINNLQFLLSEHKNQNYRFEDALITSIPKKERKLITELENLKLDQVHLKEHSGDFIIQVNDTIYDDRKIAGEKLIDRFMAIPEDRWEVSLGKYRGLDMVAEREGLTLKNNLYLVGENKYPVEINIDSGLGTITRIENIENKLEKLLIYNQDEMSELEKSKTQMQAQLKAVFPHEAELNTLLERQSELDTLLTVTDFAEEIPDENANLAGYQEQDDYIEVVTVVEDVMSME